MIERNSRYFHVKQAIHEREDGRNVSYLRRRFLPQGERMPVLVEVKTGVTDRLDLIAFRTLGDAEQFWQVCDANNAMNPFTLTDELGRLLRVPIPQFQE